LKHGVILADPPWHEKTYSNKGMGRSAAAHYDTMSIEEICALGDRVKALAARDCALFLWVTWPMLMNSHRVIEAWGAATPGLGSNGQRGKSKDGTGFRMMGGHTTRKCTELCLLGLCGKPTRLSKKVTDVIFAPPRGPHQKPDEQYAKIEELYPGPYVELFARQRWPGWNVAAYGDLVSTAADRRRIR
jgi:N6-adenosine-specific RNA methylase IME4